MMRYWYRRSTHIILWPLIPLAWLFQCIVSVRRFLYRHHLFKTDSFNAPVIVVGNLTVGGTGKTPFVIWLANFLKAEGYSPGIVSRGYGGKSRKRPYRVMPNTLIQEASDETLLIARKTACPVVICKDRIQAVRALLQETSCNIVISDDGLQHYRMDRRFEIVIVDGKRLFGNHLLLPAGPLREPLARLEEVQLVVVNGGEGAHSMSCVIDELVAIQSHLRCDLAAFPQKTVHAVAGIGHPERFFTLLRQAGLEVIPHIFPDHHSFCLHDICFDDAHPVIMTEKDAVKCEALADSRHWYADLRVEIDQQVPMQ